jgi:glucose/arabinose dehydrogenase
MLRARKLFIGLLVLAVAGGQILIGSLRVDAQDATPAPLPPTLNPVQSGGPGGGATLPGGTLPGNPSIQLVKIADGLADPVNVAAAGDGSGRLFVVERVGRIRVIDRDGNLLDEPFLDLTELVQSDYLEQGILGLAFHPDYKTNGRFYVNFTDFHTNGDTFVMEFRVSTDDPNVADRASGRLLMAFDQPYVNHNGGTIKFGPDGYLYIASGDGGGGGDPYDTAQDLSSLLGKLLRIDVEPAGGQPYGIPADNPFAEARVVQSNQITDVIGETEGLNLEAAYYHPEARREIWAYGLRNPWEFSWDTETGDLYIADVGQFTWQEINVQPANAGGGQNYGWDWLEASHCYPASVEQCPRTQVGELPVAEYRQGADGCSIIGIGVYRGDEFPALDGIYFNSDFCSGKVWGLRGGENGSWIYQQLLDTDLLVTGSGADEGGNLYVTACACDYGRFYNPQEDPQGTVWRLVAADQVPEGAETAQVDAPSETAATPVP